MAKQNYKMYLMALVLVVAAIGAVIPATPIAAISVLLVVLGIAVAAWNVKPAEEQRMLLASLALFIIGAGSWAAITAAFPIAGVDAVIMASRTFVGYLAVAFFIPAVYFSAKQLYGISKN